MKKYSITLMRHHTSISLEPEFWEILKLITMEKKLSLEKLVEEIDKTRKTNLSSAIRVYILNYLKNKLNI